MCSAGGGPQPPSSVTDIEDLHRDALLHQQTTYVDPPTGFSVFTALPHLKRGKCCGNRCRHCPYGWSNVRNAAGGGATAEDRAVSGDREGTRRLVERIMEGTYYEDDGDAGAPRASTGATRAVAAEHGATAAKNTGEGANRARPRGEASGEVSGTPPRAAKGSGRGGSAGGTLTTKNVPYTRTGDAGTSQLFTGERRAKDDELFEALGTVDELCSVAGVVYAELVAPRGTPRTAAPPEGDGADGDAAEAAGPYGDLPEQLLDVMSRLFDVGSHIARPEPTEQRGDDATGTGSGASDFDPRHTELLEEWIDAMTDGLPELTSFVLPTGSPAAAQLHVARTVCRRAERRMAPLVRGEGAVARTALAYVNRLSDYFFTAARFVNRRDGAGEVQYRWEGEWGPRGDGGRDARAQRERVVVKLK